jgi:hypothetical protein
MEHIPYPSIEQFRSIVKKVNDRCAYAGKLVRPSLHFSGAVKLHGTNASVVYSEQSGVGEVYVQSRNKVLTLEDDNAGFAQQASLDDWSEGLRAILRVCGHAEAHTVVVYGEWCGGNIQRGVALNQLPKMFVVFAIKILRGAPETLSSAWVDQISLPVAVCVLKSFAKHTLVYATSDFTTWQVKIDFNEPELVSNDLADLTAEVERKCPVGAALGVEGVGEGIVWTCTDEETLYGMRTDDLVFKVKGQKHSDSKVRTLASVDIEKLATAKACAEAVATSHRFEKAIEALRLTNPEQDSFAVESLGDFLKLVSSDVSKKETDTIQGNGLHIKDVMRDVQRLAKLWFSQQASQVQQSDAS